MKVDDLIKILQQYAGRDLEVGIKTWSSDVKVEIEVNDTNDKILIIKEQ